MTADTERDAAMATTYDAGVGHGVRLALTAVRRFGLDHVARALCDPASVLLVEKDLDAMYAEPEDWPRETDDERAARILTALPSEIRRLLVAPDTKHRRAGAARAAAEGVTARVLAIILAAAGETESDAIGLARWAVGLGRRNTVEGRGA